jgi:predicted DNA-binding protein with PD1-like motif
MRSKAINEAVERTFAIVFENGDDVMPGLVAFARDNGLHASHFTAIGAFERLTLGYFDWRIKDYVKIPVDEQVEVVSLIGDVARKDDDPQVHAHVVVAKRDGTAHGGHLLAATVRPTLEVILVESPGYLARRFDRESGLALIDPRI